MFKQFINSQPIVDAIKLIVVNDLCSKYMSIENI